MAASYIEKAKEVAYGALGSVQAGVKSLAYKAEIRTKRNLIRDLKGQWGVVMFDAMEDQDRHRIQLAYESLLRQIETIHAEIHLVERNLFIELCGETYASHIAFDEADVLQWTEEHLTGFNMVDINDLGTWYSGLGFAALVANWRPEVLDWKSVVDPSSTANAAFNGTYKAGVPNILEVEYLQEVDRRSIITQLAMYKRHFLSHKPHIDGKKTWNDVIRAGQPIRTGQNLRASGQNTNLSQGLTGHQTSGQDTHRTDQSGSHLSGDQSRTQTGYQSSSQGDQSRSHTGTQTGSSHDHSSTGLTGDQSKSQLHKESTPRSQDSVTSQDSHTK